MKKVYLTIITSIFAVSFCNAQWTQTTGTTITKANSVGIGTTTPGAALHVAGGGYILTDNGGWYSSKNNSGGLAQILGIGVDNHIYVGDLFGNVNSSLSIRTSGADRVFITATGNVLVGQSTQSNAAYKLDVAGNIRANQIVVNTTGADFVFNKTYKHRTLDQLNRYVSQYKHLPKSHQQKTCRVMG